MESSYVTILNNVKKSRRNWIMNILTFIFPFLSVVAAFGFQKVYPIGDRVMMTVDSYHQYVPFLIELRNKIVEGRSLLFSWNSGLGMEYFAAFANYTSSPLNIFCVFFTAKTMPVFVALITAVRAGLSSLFMSWFLTGEDEGRRDYLTTAFACAYALCGWFITDFWNIMWCDALVILPLIVMGLRKLFVEGKYALYVISLGVAIISNYYTGFFLCIFLVFFAPIYYFCLFQTKKETIIEGKLGIKSFAVCAFRFAVASLLAGGISAFIAIPTYKILQTTSAVGAELPKEYTLTGNLFDFLGRFLVAANPNIRDGMANVYAGVIPVLMVPLFFAADKSTGIKLRHKIAMGFMLLFMYFSFSNKTLNFIWHGFHYPNQIPYRESFLMSFLVVYIGYKALRILRSFTPSQVSAVFIGGGIFVILFEKFGTGNEGTIQILISLLFILIEGCLLRCVLTGKKSAFFYEIVISAFMAIEMLVSCCISIGFVSKNEGFPLYKTYGQNYDIIEDYANSIEAAEGHKIFERTEVYPNNICNIQSVFDVRGVSVFSSTVRENNVKFIRNLGFHNNNINSYRSAGINRVTATLLGVRNFLTTGEADSVPPIFELETELENGVLVYGNKDALSVGYMVSEDVVNLTYEETEKNVFKKTNDLVNALGIEGDAYTPVEAYVADLENITQSSGTLGQYSYSVIDSSKASKFTVVLDTENTGNDICIYFDCSKSGSFTIEKYDGDTLIKSYGSVSYRYYQIIPVGIADGSTYKVKMSLPTSPAGSIRLFTYELNRDVYDRMVSDLSDEQMTVTSYDDTSIKGTITNQNAGLMLMSVAYNDGFKLAVDGKQQEIIAVGDALVGVHLEPGTHEIELYYAPEGFTEGLLLTVVCLVVLVVICIVTFIFRRRKANALAKKEMLVIEESSADIPVETTVDSESENIISETSTEETISSETDEISDNESDDSSETGVDEH